MAAPLLPTLANLSKAGFSRAARTYSVAPNSDFPDGARATRYRQPSNDEGATASTIGMMFQLARADAQAPRLQAAAEIATAGARNPAEALQGIFDWVKARVHFREDADAAALAGLQDPDTELLIRPVDLLAMSQPAGDCDDFATLTAALLHAANIEPAFRTIAAEKGNPNYSHVFAVAVTPNGETIAMDTSHGAGPGWQAPPAGKSKLWRHSMKTLRGLAADSAGLTIGQPGYQPLTDPGNSGYDPAQDWRNYDFSGSDAGVAPASSASGTDWSSLSNPVNTLTNAFSSVFKTVAQNQPGSYVRGADGSISYRAPASGAALSLPGLGTSGSSLYVIGGLLLAGIVALKVLGSH